MEDTLNITEPTVKQTTTEELCGSTNILDTVHLKNLVEDLAKLYGTSVCTKVAKDTKVAAEKRLIEAIRANLDRYGGQLYRQSNNNKKSFCRNTKTLFVQYATLDFKLNHQAKIGTEADNIIDPNSQNNCLTKDVEKNYKDVHLNEVSRFAFGLAGLTATVMFFILFVILLNKIKSSRV